MLHDKKMNGWIDKLNRLFKCCNDIAPGNCIRLKLRYMPALRSNGKRVASYWPYPILSSCIHLFQRQMVVKLIHDRNANLIELFQKSQSTNKHAYAHPHKQRHLRVKRDTESSKSKIQNVKYMTMLNFKTEHGRIWQGKVISNLSPVLTRKL